jgi:hypothetical protein
MAATVQGRRLTEQHRKAQLAVRAAALKEALALWPVLDPLRVDDTAPVWLRLMTQLVARWRGVSAQRSADYYRALRAAETGQLAAPPMPEPPDPDTRRVVTSLRVTGPVRIKQLTQRGEPPREVARQVLPEASAAAGRHVLDGGRQQLLTAAIADEHAVGWARITDAKPCAFCAMLASRGFVYLSEASAARTTRRSKRGPGQQYHDRCGCTVEVAFSRDTPLPERNAEFERLWADTTGGYSGKDAINAFRRALEAQRRAS